jgi:hypothetical protein
MAASFRRVNVGQYDEEHIILPKDLVIPENPLSTKIICSTWSKPHPNKPIPSSREETPRMALTAVLSAQLYGSSAPLMKAKVRASKLD